MALGIVQRTGIRSLHVGDSHVCVHVDGNSQGEEVWCWGRNNGNAVLLDGYSHSTWAFALTQPMEPAFDSTLQQVFAGGNNSGALAAGALLHEGQVVQFHHLGARCGFEVREHRAVSDGMR